MSRDIFNFEELSIMADSLERLLYNFNSTECKHPANAVRLDEYELSLKKIKLLIKLSKNNLKIN